MKNKKWVDMDADELQKEGKTFKWMAVSSLIGVLIFWIITMVRFLLVDKFNYITSFVCIMFFFLAIFGTIIKFHLEQLMVIKNIIKR